MKKILLSAFIFFIGIVGVQASEVTVTFGDSEFCGMVFDEIKDNYSTIEITDFCNANKGIVFTDGEDILDIDYLSLNYNQPARSGVSDISGIEKFVNLEGLELAHNKISDLTPIKGLTKLNHLFLNGNNISDITALEGLTNLEKLFLNNNFVIDINSLSKLTKLEYLYINKNKLIDLTPIKGLTNLIELGFSESNVSDISMLNKLVNLELLQFGYSKVADISVLKNFPKLKTLRAGQNNIEDISVLKKFTEMDELCIWGNHIEDFTPLKDITINNYIDISEQTFTVYLTKGTKYNLPMMFSQYGTIDSMEIPFNIDDSSHILEVVRKNEDDLVYIEISEDAEVGDYISLTVKNSFATYDSKIEIYIVEEPKTEFNTEDGKIKLDAEKGIDGSLKLKYDDVTDEYDANDKKEIQKYIGNQKLLQILDIYFVDENEDKVDLEFNNYNVFIEAKDLLLKYNKIRIGHLNSNGSVDEWFETSVNGTKMKFLTYHFSDYVIVGETIENPNTSDNIIYIIVTATISFVGLIASSIIIKSKKAFN